MPESLNQKKQVWFLTAWSLAFLIPLYWIKGASGVTLIYSAASGHFWNKLNPYVPSVVLDIYHYSPFFAFIYYPLTLLPSFLHVFLWAFLNIFIFWSGMGLWFKLNWKQPAIVLFALICSAMELDISMRYEQCNAMMAGFILMSLHHLKESKHWRSGIFYALAVNFKIFPIVFGLALLKKWKALLFSVLFLLLLAMIPALYVGPKGIVKLHLQQYESIQKDTINRRMSDLRPTFERKGLPELGKISHYSVIFFFLLYSLRLFLKQSKIPLDLYYCLTAATILLISPRTESPTFIMIAPAYVFLALCLPKWLYPPFLFALFIITFVFTAAWDPFFHLKIQNGFFSKTMGTFVLWFVCVVEILRRELQDRNSLRRLNSDTLPNR